ncbi:MULTISPECIES: amino acid transporter [unclassified Roseitalea]|uniref:amino acid transporter n=1 Tax=unclassified Roseitalea TaxID=2639107 RepID=UPI00273D9002|nr:MULTISPECIES: amino acid transporter [unclassified Roseitalea]
MSLATTIHNERIKLLAGYLNGLAIAVIAVGGLAPIISSLYGSAQASGFLIFVSVFSLLVSSTLHYVGSMILKRLRQ